MAGEISPAEMRRLLALSTSILGRNQGPELFYQTTFDPANVSTINVPRALAINRPIEAIMITMKFRVAVTVANFTAVAPEAPQNLLQSIQVQGTHKDFGNITPIKMSGATAYVWPGLTQETCGDVLINGTRAVDPGRPFTSPFLGTTAGSPYDIILNYVLPLGPMLGLGQSVKRQGVNFLYQPADWTDSLLMQLTIGDKSALGDPTGATVVFSGYGGAGNPSIAIHLVYSILGQFANRMGRSGFCVRTEQTVPSLTALGNSQKLLTLQKQITSNVVIKSGAIQTAGLTAGVDTLATLSDVQLDRTQISVDNKPVRNNSDNLLFKTHIQRQFGTVIPQGYFVLSFVDGQSSALAYRGDGLPGGSQMDVLTDVLVASANNRQRVIQEMIYGGPF